MLVLLAATAPAAFSASPVKDSIVAYVNGECISADEFRLFVHKHRAHVFSEFRERHGIEDSKDFWTTPLGDRTPIDRLRQVALEDCVRSKMYLLMARDKGILEDVTYTGFVNRLAQENRRRKEAVARGQVIFGPVEYGESTGYAHFLSLLCVDIKKKLAEQFSGMDEDVLQNFYEANKERYRSPGRVRVQMLVAQSPEEKADLKRLAEARLPNETLAELHQRKPSSVRLIEATLGDREQAFREEDPVLNNLLEEVRYLGAGECSQLIEGEKSRYLVQCITRDRARYEEFGGAFKHIVREHWVEQEYERALASMVKTAEVRINQPIYESIGAR